MNQASKRKSINLAHEHVDFLLGWTEYIFCEAFIHGYKHGQEDLEEDNSADKTKQDISTKSEHVSCPSGQMYDDKTSPPFESYP